MEKGKLLKYRGYLGKIDLDLETGKLIGKVLFINDSILFEGKTLKELEKDFQEAIDLYLEFCEKRGVVPNKTFTGKLNIRTKPELHKKLMEAATQKNLSLNSFVEKCFEYGVNNVNQL